MGSLGRIGRRGSACARVAVVCLALAGCTRFGVNPYIDRGPSVDGQRPNDGARVEARDRGGDWRPVADWTLVAEGQAADTKPAVDRKPAADAKPAADTKPAPDNKPAPDTKPTPDTKPAPDTKPVADKPVPLTGLVAAWPLDDGSGQVVSAAAGSAGYLGNNSSGDAADPLWEKTAARVCAGSALTFDGNDDIVTIPGPSTAGLAKFTITFSLHATGAGGGSLARILSKENGGSSDTLVHYRHGDSAIAVNMFNTADTLFATFASGVVMNQRANWALTYDDTGDRRLHAYKNGNETTYARQDVMTGTLRTTTNSWMIGNQSSGVRAFDGTIDEVRVFNRVLSPSEIVALSNLCPPP